MQSNGEFSLAFGRAFGAVVVDIHGALDADSAGVLRDRLTDVIDGQGNRHLVMDLAGTTRIDATGLAVLLDAHTRIQKNAGTLVLSGASPGVLFTVEAAGLDKVFTLTPAWAHPAHGRRATKWRLTAG
jgi:stage II sporulation protein AA (anti-sigma F factor antagonist)